MESTTVSDLENQQFLGSSSDTPPTISKSVLCRLYVSHFLSTWNSRLFEFGAVLFLASIFRDTLLYASVYALVRSLSSVLFSSSLGSVVDRSNRLKAIRMSIVWQRLPVVASCACFLVLLQPSSSSYLSPLVFIAAVLFACVEKLAASANSVAVERDWAIVISNALHISKQDLNATMRRIDLFCKLLAPLAVSLIDGFSTRLAIWIVLVWNFTTVWVEYIAIAQVYKSVPNLERLPDTIESTTQSLSDPWRAYFASPMVLPSFALSLLYLTVLSFGPTMTTYLLHSTSFTSIQVSTMRIGAILVEIAGTWVAPVLMRRIGPIRSGLWFLNWQFACLAAPVASFAMFRDVVQQGRAATCLVVGVALSRLGLWGFDLSIQLLIQEGIDPQSRAKFSSTEIALQSIWELVSFAMTIVFPHPEQFKFPVYISYGAITMAAICFATYVRRERGHLLHMDRCMGEKVRIRTLGR